MDAERKKRADRVAELLVELSCVPRTDTERVAMLGFAVRALQPPELGGPPKGRAFDISGWHAQIVNALEAAFRPSNAPGGPTTPPEARTASSDAESEPEGRCKDCATFHPDGCTNPKSGINWPLVFTALWDACPAFKPKPESEPERVCGQCALLPRDCPWTPAPGCTHNAGGCPHFVPKRSPKRSEPERQPSYPLGVEDCVHWRKGRPCGVSSRCPCAGFRENPKPSPEPEEQECDENDCVCSACCGYDNVRYDGD